MNVYLYTKIPYDEIGFFFSHYKNKLGIGETMRNLSEVHNHYMKRHEELLRVLAKKLNINLNWCPRFFIHVKYIERSFYRLEYRFFKVAKHLATRFDIEIIKIDDRSLENVIY